MTANASAEIRVFGDVKVSCKMRPMSLVGKVVDCASSSDSGPSESSRRGGMVDQRMTRLEVFKAVCQIRFRPESS